MRVLTDRLLLRSTQALLFLFSKQIELLMDPAQPYKCRRVPVKRHESSMTLQYAKCAGHWPQLQMNKTNPYIRVTSILNTTSILSRCVYNYRLINHRLYHNVGLNSIYFGNYLNKIFDKDMCKIIVFFFINKYEYTSRFFQWFQEPSHRLP